jgi:RNA polymerase sigma factor (sigma-70 family)
MNKEEIILQFYNSPNPMQICKKISDSYYTTDLLHECILTLYDLDEQKILDAYKNNYLSYLFYKIVSNSYVSYTSPFAKKYRHFNQTTDDFKKIQADIEIENDNYEELFERFIQHIENDIESFEEYERELFKLYVQFRDFRKISNLVGIKYGAVRHSILQTIKKLKEKYNGEFNNLLTNRISWLCSESSDDRFLEEEI